MVGRWTQTPVKYIFSESTIIVDYEGIFINIKKYKLFQRQRAISQGTEVHSSSSFPDGFEQNITINTPMFS